MNGSLSRDKQRGYSNKSGTPHTALPALQGGTPGKKSIEAINEANTPKKAPGATTAGTSG